MKINFIDHISLIVRNLDETESFYSKFLGEPILKNENLRVYKIGELRLYFRLISKTEASYDKDNIGMNHIGFGVRSMDELKDMKNKLTELGIQHSDFKVGKFGNDYVWLDDPNGFRLEFYSRPE